MNAFQDGGYQNRWSSKKYKDKTAKVSGHFECELKIDRFILTLVITYPSGIELRKQILTTDADELAYHYRFDKIEFREKCIVVLDKSGSEVHEEEILEI